MTIPIFAIKKIGRVLVPRWMAMAAMAYDAYARCDAKWKSAKLNKWQPWWTWCPHGLSTSEKKPWDIPMVSGESMVNLGFFVPWLVVNISWYGGQKWDLNGIFIIENWCWWDKKTKPNGDLTVNQGFLGWPGVGFLTWLGTPSHHGCFKTKSWSSDLDGLGYPHFWKPPEMLLDD